MIIKFSSSQGEKRKHCKYAVAFFQQGGKENFCSRGINYFINVFYINRAV